MIVTPTEETMTDRRRMISHHVSAEGNETVSLNFRKWKGVVGFVGAVLGTSVTIATLVLSMLKPVVTRWVAEETAPHFAAVSESLTEIRSDVTRLKQTAVDRNELDGRMARLEARLDDIYSLLAKGGGPRP